MVGGAFNGSTAATTIGGNIKIALGTFTASSGAITVAGNLTIVSGTLDGGTANISVGGNWLKTGGTWTPNAGTVTFTATDTGNTLTTNDSAESFYDLVFNGSGGVWSADKNVTVNHNMTVTAGTFQTAQNQGTAGDEVTVGGTLLIDANGIFIARYSSLTANSNTGAGQTITAADITINSGGSMNADKQGFPGGQGPGYMGSPAYGATYGEAGR
jgi:hypothetical protein